MRTELWCSDTDREKTKVFGAGPVPVPFFSPQITKGGTMNHQQMSNRDEAVVK